MPVIVARLLRAFSIAAVAFPFAASASALYAQEAKQNYLTLPYEPTLRGGATEVFRIIRGASALEANTQRFNDYFQKYVLAEMTLPEKLADLPEMRRSFFVRFHWATKENQEVRDHLNKLAVDTLKTVVGGNFHPAARHNAVILIGQLDAQPPVSTGRDRKPPIPYSGATDFLIRVFNYDSSANPIPEYVKAGCLVGLERHARYGAAPELRDELTTSMIATLKKKARPEGRDPEVHAWFRRSAARILGHLGQPGGNNAVARELIEVMNDSSAALAVRSDAAWALGQLNFDGGDLGLDVAALVNGLGQLAFDLSVDHRRRVGNLAPNIIVASFLYMAGNVQTGFNAAKSLAKDADKTKADALEKTNQGALASIQQSSTADASVRAALDQVQADLRQVLGIAAAAPAAKSKTTPAAEGEKKKDPFGSQGF